MDTSDAIYEMGEIIARFSEQELGMRLDWDARTKWATLFVEIMAKYEELKNSDAEVSDG